MFKNFFIFVVVSLAFLSACTDEGSADGVEQEKLIIPLLEECEQYVKTYLDSIPEAIGVSYSIVKSDYELRAIPSLSGYIEIRGARYNKDQLMATANTFILACYPESRTTIDKNQDNAGKALMNALEMNRRLGANKNYIVDDEDKIHIFINLQ